MTRRVLECLRAQRLDEPLRMIVIDDGSTDGTGDFLSMQRDVTVLQGNGSLWWGGAIELGLQNVLKLGNKADWVLLVNNDTTFSSDFVQKLLDAARTNAPAAVGSVICDEKPPNQLLSIGAMLDPWRLRVGDKLDNLRSCEGQSQVHDVDALSGRGVLYPLATFLAAGTMKPRWLPHYLADYELAVRVRKAGYRLLVSEEAVVLSANEFGNAFKPASLGQKFFAVRSAYYLPAVLAFWWGASSNLERLTLLPRLLFIGIRRQHRGNNE